MSLKEIKVLDKGFVRLETFAGSDDAVVRAARVSYGAKPPDPEKDKKLISFMLNAEHGSPFEHNLFTFHVKAPIFVFRQWHRTRIGVSYNEVSARYSEMPDEYYTPDVYRAQDTKNKQGSLESDNLDHKLAKEIVERNNSNSMKYYRDLLHLGVAREMARMVLPVNLYSQMYFSANARSLMYFVSLRSDAHAQAETRQYAHAMACMFEGCMPWTFAALKVQLESRDNKDYSELWKFRDELAERV